MERYIKNGVDVRVFPRPSTRLVPQTRRLDDGQMADLRDAELALPLNADAVDDIIRLGRDEWAIWMHGSEDPVVGCAEDGELADADPGDIEDIDRLLWLMAQPGDGGMRPPESCAVIECKGFQVEIELGAHRLTGRYQLRWRVFGDGEWSGVPGGPVESAILGELEDRIFNSHWAEEVWSQALSEDGEQ